MSRKIVALNGEGSPIMCGAKRVLLTVVKDLGAGLVLVKVPKYAQRLRALVRGGYQLILEPTGIVALAGDDAAALEDFGVLLASTPDWGKFANSPDRSKAIGLPARWPTSLRRMVAAYALAIGAREGKP